MSVLVMGRCHRNCRGGQRGMPGHIGGGWTCACECHGWDAEKRGTKEFPCGNNKTSSWDGIDPDYRRLVEQSD